MGNSWEPSSVQPSPPQPAAAGRAAAQTEMQLRAATHDDLAAVRQLLSSAGLPLDGVEDNFADFIVAEEERRIAGVIGVERYGSAALLRSAAVLPDARGTGVGGRLVREPLDRASAPGVR